MTPEQRAEMREWCVWWRRCPQRERTRPGYDLDFVGFNTGVPHGNDVDCRTHRREAMQQRDGQST